MSSNDNNNTTTTINDNNSNDNNSCKNIENYRNDTDSHMNNDIKMQKTLFQKSILQDNNINDMNDYHDNNFVHLNNETKHKRPAMFSPGFSLLFCKDSESIKNAIKETIEKFGDIDVIVNNAGYGLSGAFEGATEEQIKKQFDTNVFGVMSVIREILPLFRKNKKGLIINVTSMGGKVTFPLYSLYHSSKWALEGWSESMAFELNKFGIGIKAPGSPCSGRAHYTVGAHQRVARLLSRDNCSHQ